MQIENSPKLSFQVKRQGLSRETFDQAERNQTSLNCQG